MGVGVGDGGREGGHCACGCVDSCVCVRACGCMRRGSLWGVGCI